MSETTLSSALPVVLPASVFVGRDEPIAAFREHLEAEAGAPLRVLVLHGAPGSGKSTLLRALHANAGQVAPPVPHAWFNLKNVNDRPQAYREVLASWRVTLGDTFGLRFPRFDVCLALMLAREGNDQSPFLTWCPSLGPLYEAGKMWLAEPGQAMAGFAESRQAGAASGANYWLEPGADGQPRLGELCRRLAADETGVAAELVNYFAGDMKDGLWGRANHAVGGVLFLDSYESLWPGDRVLLPQFDQHVDWWVRELAAFCLAQGILLVIGAREPLRWAQNDADWSALALEQRELAGLTPREAQDFLARCGIGPAHPDVPSSLQRAIMRSASPTGGGGLLNQWTNRQLGDSLPLWLALCADVVQNQRRAGKGDPGAASFALVSASQPGKKLCDLLLKSLHEHHADDWLLEVALTPRCDEQAAPESRGDVAERLLNWERFTELSFVEDQGDGFWRIEPAVRHELLAQRRRDETLEAHLNFSHHWAERGEEALAWFHQWALDPKGALEKWAALHAEAMQAGEANPSEFSRARALLSWWGEVALDERDLETVEDEIWARAHAIVARALHDTPFMLRSPALALAMAHYEAALTVYAADEHPREWATTQVQMGNVQRALSRECATIETSEEYLKAAIERYRAALKVATPQAAPREWGEIQIQLAGAHRDLMALDAHGTGPFDYLGRSIACYEQAMRLYSEGRHPRQWARIQIQMGETYAASHSGGRARNLQRAIACFENALRVFTEHETPRDWADALCALGGTLAEIPSGSRSENLREALTCYVGALRVYSAEQTPALWAQTNLQTGLAWGEYAYVTDDRAAFRSAVNYITTAVPAFEHIGRMDEARKAKALADDISSALKRLG